MWTRIRIPDSGVYAERRVIHVYSCRSFRSRRDYRNIRRTGRSRASCCRSRTNRQLGRYFSTHHGIQFVGLRIGSTGGLDRPTGEQRNPSDSYNMAMFISKRDMIQAVTLALNIETEVLLAYAISNNDSRIFDLTETNEKLGFFPVDNSANY